MRPFRRTGCLLLLIALPAAAGSTNTPLARFRLEGTARDALGRCPDLELKNAAFPQGVLHVNGRYENGGDPLGCRVVATVPALDCDRFTVGIDLLPIDFNLNTGTRMGFLRSLLSCVTRGWIGQTASSSHDTLFVAGTGYRWFGFRQQEGQLQLTLNNQNFVHTFTNVSMTPGKWHTIICAADFPRREIRTFLDGKKLQTVQLPADFQLNTAGTGEPAEREFTLSNYSNGSVFHGYAADLQIFDGAMSDGEIRTLLPWVAHLRPLVGGAGFDGWLWLIPGLLMAGVWFWRRRRSPSGQRAHDGRGSIPSTVMGGGA